MASLSLYTMFGIALVAATPTIEAAQVCMCATGRAGAVWLSPSGPSPRMAITRVAGYIPSPDDCLPLSHGCKAPPPPTHPPTTTTGKSSCPPTVQPPVPSWCLQIMSTSLNFLFNILNGFVVSYNDIPVYWQWLNRCGRWVGGAAAPGRAGWRHLGVRWAQGRTQGWALARAALPWSMGQPFTCPAQHPRAVPLHLLLAVPPPPACIPPPWCWPARC